MIIPTIITISTNRVKKSKGGKCVYMYSNYIDYSVLHIGNSIPILGEKKKAYSKPILKLQKLKL